MSKVFGRGPNLELSAFYIHSIILRSGTIPRAVMGVLSGGCGTTSPSWAGREDFLGEDIFDPRSEI